MKGLLGRGYFVLWLSGSVLFGYGAFGLARFELFQLATATAAPAGVPSYKISPLLRTLSRGAVLAGRLEMPRLHLSVPVMEGEEDQGLALGAVHLAGSAAPGDIGNVVIAGHRDTAFWPLRNVRVGDLIHMRANAGYTYQVISVRVVTPDDTSVVANGTEPTMTLVTCYPFRHVGSSPERFIVRAKLVGRFTT